MYCTNCGKQIPDGANFCVNCGTPVLSEEPAAAKPVFQQQTQQIYQQPAHAVRSTAASNQVSQQPYATAYAASANKKVTSRWPASTGIMGVLYFIFTLASLVPYFFYYVEVIESPLAFLNVYRIIHILLVIAVPILFFVHTKKAAFVTAIPMFIMLVMDLISFFGNVRYYYSDILLREIAMILPYFILVVLYVIQMFVRSRSAAMPVVYLIIAILYILASLVLRLIGFRGMLYSDSYFAIGNLITWFAGIFAYIAYIIAMFSSRKR
ncbi:MAG: zinc ribbon domain-containing protein [Lachnospiraceae bacterium]|nr:zinc ribbon domain-containing protein [Lachnospiraceae bacterium]